MPIIVVEEVMVMVVVKTAQKEKSEADDHPLNTASCRTRFCLFIIAYVVSLVEDGGDDDAAGKIAE
jgi:hypothetical protein